MKRLILVFLTLCVVHCFSFLRAQNDNLGIRKIVIDPGHGGKDPGTLGSGRYKTTEKDVVLDVSLLLGDYLKSAFPNLQIIYTRNNDRFVKLSERTRIANEAQADLFLSIHADAFKDKRVYGATTYVMGLHKTASNLNVAIRENSSILMENNYQSNYEGFDPEEPESYIALSMYQSNHLSNSVLLASKIQHQFKTRVNRKDRGVKQAGFLVLSRATMPSVLIELGFLTNHSEEDFLISKQGKIYMASAIFRAVKEYKIEMESLILESQTKNNNMHQLFFSLQFLSSNTKISIDDLHINDKQMVFEFKDGDLYKYTYGKVKTLDEVSILKKQIKSYGYSDSFTVAILNGDKISLSDALLIVQ